jgi:exosortase D (VPLPA-CTERM-specific)
MQSVLNSFLPVRKQLLFVWLALAAVLVGVLFHESFIWMYDQWMNMEEYSHGIMIPFVSLYLVWQRRAFLVNRSDFGSLFGLGMIVLSLGLFVVTDLAGIYVGVILSFLLLLYGLVLSSIGWKNTRELLAPLLILVFMVPLPAFINNNLSSELQLLSSQIGVAFIRLFEITVYLEGNVIDLGSYKLQVVDACSGLRYLYPLVSLGFILAYLCQIPFWLRLVIFVSTIPITVIMNSIRIGAIGVSVEYWGPEMAEGLLHDVEGWFMFMASLGVLLVELALLLKLTGDKRKISSLIMIEPPVAKQKTSNNHSSQSNVTNGPPLLVMILSICVLGGVTAYTLSLTKEEEIIPQRLSLNHFPLIVGDWFGKPDSLDGLVLDALKLDDYVIANYSRGDDQLNFYVAYYGSQKKGESAHSPRSCIPGGGWIIESIEEVRLGDIYLESNPLFANRTVIRKGDVRQVVYYWFQQRGRIVTNEYLVKWYIFKDALTANRTDGALVRLSVPLKSEDQISVADNLVTDFMNHVQFRMNDFIPN